jgi:hypothetical protein
MQRGPAIRFGAWDRWKSPGEIRRDRQVILALRRALGKYLSEQLRVDASEWPHQSGGTEPCRVHAAFAALEGRVTPAGRRGRSDREAVSTMFFASRDAAGSAMPSGVRQAAYACPAQGTTCDVDDCVSDIDHLPATASPTSRSARPGRDRHRRAPSRKYTMRPARRPDCLHRRGYHRTFAPQLPRPAMHRPHSSTSRACPPQAAEDRRHAHSHSRITVRDRSRILRPVPESIADAAAPSFTYRSSGIPDDDTISPRDAAQGTSAV